MKDDLLKQLTAACNIVQAATELKRAIIDRLIAHGVSWEELAPIDKFAALKRMKEQYPEKQLAHCMRIIDDKLSQQKSD